MLASPQVVNRATTLAQLAAHSTHSAMLLLSQLICHSDENVISSEGMFTSMSYVFTFMTKVSMLHVKGQ